MIDVRAIQGLYRYNSWANSRAFEAVSQLSPEAFVKDLGSSHPSVRDTLLHLVWAEWIWLQRWNGVSPRTVFQATDFPILTAVRGRWSAVEAEQRACIVARDVLATLRLRADPVAEAYVDRVRAGV